MKKLFLPAIALGAALALGGCSFGFESDNLLHPPKTTGREAAIEKLVEEASGGSYKLKYPNSGSYRSAIVTEDFNSDGTDEAIAFFSAGSEKSVHLLVMCSDKDGDWKNCGDFDTGYTEVDSVLFADYDFDGTSEILVGFSGTGDLNELLVFDYDKDKKTTVKNEFTTSYSGFCAGDYDRDGGSEILAFTIESGETASEAKLIDYDNSVLYTLATCPMDTNVTRFDNICSGLLNKETMGVAVDGALEKGFNTQIIYYDSDKTELLNYPLTTGKKQAPTYRTYSLKSQDIDQDGFIEIPITDAEPPSGAANAASIINWRSLNTEKSKLSDKLRCISNLDYGFYFKLPDYFTNDVYAVMSDDSRETDIVSGSDANGEKLLTIRVFDVGATSEKMKGYSTLESYNQYIYAYKLGDSETLYVDDNTVRENFALNDISA